MNRGILLRVGLLAGLVAAWGLNYLFVRVGLADSPPLWLAAIRAGVGTLGVSASLLVARLRVPLSRAELRDALLVGVPNTGLFFGLWFIAAGSVPPGQTAVVIYTFPLWVVLLSVPVLHERLSAVAGVAILAGFVGVVLLSQPWLAGGSELTPATVGELLGAAAAWAFGTVFYKRRFRGPTMRTANMYQLASGSAFLLVLSLFFEPSASIHWTATLTASVLWLGLVGTAFAYAVWFWLLDRYPATIVSSWVFLVPVVALGASISVTGERLGLVQVFGVALVLSSILGVSRASRTSQPSAPVAGEADGGSRFGPR